MTDYAELRRKKLKEKIRLIIKLIEYIKYLKNIIFVNFYMEY